jgi:hypothetical protein
MYPSCRRLTAHGQRLMASRYRPKSVQNHIARALRDGLREVRSAMEAAAAALPPEELNRVGFRLYERFRPDVPDGV